MTDIRELDRPTTLEAAQLLAAELGAETDKPPFDHEILSSPTTHQDELEDLARVLLVAASALDPEAVDSAVQGAGRKQLVLGGGELVALAYLVVNGLRITLARARKSESTETITIERDDEGHEVVKVVRNNVQYEVAERTTELLKELINRLPGP
jgi:hypothetical protein